ncbi:unannotated protein [freshwater metagenome]|uniref:Unannotated protein n=1 Tax=freshwater metagenome TaxID=449393 RepID=A0A6J7CP18_9ZZZZ
MIVDRHNAELGSSLHDDSSRGEFNARIVQFYLASVELALSTREFSVAVIRLSLAVINVGPGSVNFGLPIADALFAVGNRGETLVNEGKIRL